MRALAVAAVGVINAGNVAAAILVLIDTTPALAFASCAVNLSWGGVEYLGTGNLGDVQPVRDAVGSQSGLRLSLSGVPTEALSLALRDDLRDRAVVIRYAILDPNTHQVLDAPVIATGSVDQMPIEAGVDASTIGVVVSHRGETFARPKALRYTDVDQKKLYPGDTALRWVVSQSQKQDVWPAAAFFRQG